MKKITIEIDEDTFNALRSVHFFLGNNQIDVTIAEIMRDATLAFNLEDYWGNMTNSLEAFYKNKVLQYKTTGE
ncbi:hypothetical protein EOM81_11655 [bacterium]|nr:hypothetical protein [bacterium]